MVPRRGSGADHGLIGRNGGIFANHSWKDILIAFSTNLRQVNRINALAERIHLEVLVENSEALQVLSTKGYAALVVWIKIDVGNGRTGVDWQNSDEVWTLCEEIQKDLHLKLAGLLTHSGTLTMLRIKTT